MKDLYDCFENLSDGEQLALKNADLALESGDVGEFNAAKDLAEKYNSKDFFDKIGLDSEYDIKKKYNILSDCDNSDVISEYQFYEYASQHGYDIDVTVYVDENGKVIATSLDKDYVPKETDCKVSMEESLTLSEEELKQRITEMESKNSQTGTESGKDNGNNVADSSEIKDSNPSSETSNKEVDEKAGDSETNKEAKEEASDGESESKKDAKEEVADLETKKDPKEELDESVTKQDTSDTEKEISESSANQENVSNESDFENKKPNTDATGADTDIATSKSEAAGKLWKGDVDGACKVMSDYGFFILGGIGGGKLYGLEELGIDGFDLNYENISETGNF